MKVGDLVQINTERAPLQQYDGCEGEIVAIVRGCVYVSVGWLTPCFYLDEIEIISAPLEQSTV